MPHPPQHKPSDSVLHRFEHSAEVLVAVAGSLRRNKGGIRGRRERQRLADLVPEAQCEPHVLLRVLEREIDVVVAHEHLWPLQAVHRRRDGSLLYHLEDVVATQPRFCTDSEALAQGDQVDAHHHIDDELHAGAAPNIPEEEGALPHHVEARLGSFLQGLVTTREEDEGACQGGPFGAADRRLEEAATLADDRGTDLFRASFVYS
mmetsp:Transcript_42632/g.117621  ORF Transcript_42632/g.117621 Transcript_42632/m.117621 type:complete len:205 (+) Transcript_42632:77-691(+)